MSITVYRALPALAVGALALAAGCMDEVVPPPGDGAPAPRDTVRVPDPGLTYTVECLTDGVPDRCLDPPLDSSGNVCMGGSLPPDAIPAIVDPAFLRPEDVDYLNPLDRVFGIEIDGRAYAFPRKIMNYHEAVTFSVRDDNGDLVVRTTASWCPLTFSFIEWRYDGWRLPEAGRSSSFGVSGALIDNNLVMYDRESRSTWGQILGRSLIGPKAGECLEIGRNMVDTTYDIWRKLHPETVVLTNQPNIANPFNPNVYNVNPYADWWSGKVAPPEPISFLDTRLPPQTVVLVVAGAEGTQAVQIREGGVAQAEIQGTPMVFFTEATFTNEMNPPTTFVFENALDGVVRTFGEAEPDAFGLPRFRDEETGSVWSLDGIALEGPLRGRRLAQVPAFHVYWFAWAAMKPGTAFDAL